MKQEEIAHLANLARIRLSDEELENLEEKLSLIVEYVSVVSDIAAGDDDAAPQVGARHNVFRKDEVTNEPDQYTKDILAEMPATEGRFMAVKKILDTDSE
ncbi:Asp-tRNA(Asn)/Glu-tRNA(Gln) amidotransferase subunit GatC [Candidatus Kaiserbacteria bacterium]|nr:Asp-tRNA(Asn)/Glu-tRNA(Gln) amidotransferase subunit GatC [Candidatus Kaiserbacteria bacterium]MCB9812162.1 Asp-tRNA(Asn)/Glu-tRNA(Gln) amidotransferase subunit GatC [Candidatus Nomurabacteria bacterium]